jgi:translation initiation factor 2 beta subunit (eIF-2beta)/eIF-5
MEITITPENAELNQRLQQLHADFTEVFIAHKTMVEDQSPILTSLYLEKLGRLQLTLLERQTELSRIKMKIAMIQAAINRNEQADMDAINREVSTRLEKYYKQIAEQSSAIDSAKSVLSGLLSADETKKLKEVFYVLCKRLHPDLNPAQREEDKDLFITVKAAYDLQNLSELQRILLFVDESRSSDLLTHSSDEKRNRIEQLENNIAVLRSKMDQIRREFPFTIEAMLYDEDQLGEKQREIEADTAAIQEEVLKQQTILELLCDE